MVGSDPLEQSSLAIGDIDPVQEISNTPLGHMNTKSDLDDIHDGSEQPRRGASSKQVRKWPGIPSRTRSQFFDLIDQQNSNKGPLFRSSQGPQGFP